MTLYELINQSNILIEYDYLADPQLNYRIELFDQDNWQYEIEGVEVCPITKRIIFNLKLVGEKEDES